MATKSAKKTAKKVDTVDFSKSINTITGTAKTVNKQVMKATEAVAEDLVKQGAIIKDVAVKTVKEQSDVAIKTVKKTYANVAEVMTVANVKKTAKNTNKAALKAADGLVEGVIAGSEQWQGVATKAINGGIKLADKQQDIVFTALEAMKGQVLKSADRFGRLFSRN